MTAIADARFAFELGFAPVMAAMLSLGPQNTLVLRQGVSRRHVIVVAGTCFGCDLGLIALAVLGFGSAIGTVPAGLMVLRSFGACYLLLMSARSFIRAAGRGGACQPGGRCYTQRVVLAALAVSLLNPLAWIETALVIGAVSTTVKVNLLAVFALGAALGSLCKFSALGYGARVLAPLSSGLGSAALAGTVMAGTAGLLIEGLMN